MTAFQLHGPARKCAADGRELKPGDRIVSVLVDEGGKFERKDYSADAWTGPPGSFVAYWAGRVPTEGRRAKPVVNDDLLVDCFEHLTETDDPSRRRFRYVTALLLLRRKRFRFEDAARKDGADLMIVRDAKSGRRHEVIDPKLTEPEMDAVQDEVFRVLGWE